MARQKCEGEATYEAGSASWRVRDMPERLRPREEMERMGVENVSDGVLVAILLRTGVRGCNVVDLAQRLLRTYGSLTELAGASVDELAAAPGMGRVKAQILKAALEIGKRLTEESLPKRFQVRTPEDAARVLREKARALDREVFWVLRLDAKNFLKGPPEEITQGLLDVSMAHPREVFRGAIRSSTAAVVLVHNHPSGDPTASAEDVRITRQLVQAGKIVDIKVMDHVILGKAQDGNERDFASIREQGLVDFA